MSASLENINNFVYDWEIKNFRFCPLDHDEYLRSPEFTVNLRNETNWCLNLYPRGRYPGYDTDPDYISCYLVRMDDRKEVSIGVKFEVIGANGEAVFSKNRDNVQFVKSSFWGCTDFKKCNDNLYFSKDSLSIRCTLWSNLIPYSGRCSAWTDIGVEKCSFKCTAEIFSTDVSPIDFSLPRNSKFKIAVATAGEDVIFEIQRADLRQPSLVLTAKITLLDVKGNQACKIQELVWFRKGNNSTYFNLLKKSQLLSEKFFVIDAVRLFCEFEISNGKTEEEIGEYQLIIRDDQIPKSQSESVVRDFKSMYTTEKMSDIVLRAGGRSFSAHKFVLSARSPVFCAMFENDMIENQNGVVDIPDLDADTLDALLIFMYEGSVVDLDHNRAVNLLLASNKYLIPQLKEMCSAYLSSNLSVETAYETLRLADCIEDGSLKSSAEAFFLSHIRTILKSESWKKLVESNRNLAMDILVQFAMDNGSD